MNPSETVFLDTSIFKAENYFAPDNRIHTLSDLARKGKIHLVMSTITCQEVRKHIKSDIRAAWKAFDHEIRPLRNNPDLDAWRKSTNEKQEIDAALKLFDDFLAEAAVTVLDYSYCSDVEIVFNQYFGRRKPFGDGMKKDEFPDAFVLAALEKYAIEKHSTIVVLSQDSDISGYESARLRHEDYRQYVSDKLKEGAALEALNVRLVQDKEYLESCVQKEAFEYLDDFRIYMSYLNHLDVTGHDVKKVSVEINAANYEVIAIHPNYIEIELLSDVDFIVAVDYHDFDTATYDSEDRRWYGVEDGTYEINATATVPLTLKYFFMKKAGDNDALDIVNIGLEVLMDVIE